MTKKNLQNTSSVHTELLISVMDYCLHGTIVIDENYRVIFWNQWMEKYTEIKSITAVDEQLFTLFPHLMGKRIQWAIDDALNRGNSAALSQTLNNAPLPLHSGMNKNEAVKQAIFIKPIGIQGENRFCVIQVQDVTSSLRREKLLRDTANKAEDAKIAAEKLTEVKTEFISTVSHELRTPLTSILGSLGLLCGGAVGNLSAQVSSLINLAHRNSQNLLALINDLLDIDKIESGKMDFVFANMKVTPFLEESILRNSGFASKHNIQFNITPAQDDVDVCADGNRLMQVMSNLLSNAAKFSPKGGAVEISTTLTNNKVRISISDHGLGIAEDFQPHLFEKFTQVDSSNTRQVNGSGLGLSITKAIIEQHDGNIGFNTTLGEGSTFYFELPVITTNADIRKACN
ncbi:MAG: HAMP domain-containing histidine kinase [Ectothiorhodospiraceae bacterium]|nr:HAMP domain-containing histidine kinase [Ectothiorhodospiraceae bacterium]